MMNDKKELTASDILAITEAYRVYCFLDEKCKKQIPSAVKVFLEENKDLSVGAELHPEVPLEMQDISQEGWNLIAYLGTYFK